ncbi:hypothetical protein HDU82_001370 [Entophlyctis luteolus]|nr:hypothetical protein HDU82_001370 [Entophlyctis luteolus]
MARSSGLITTACCPNDAVVSPPHRIPSSLNKRRVSFNKQLISSVQFTHAATDYDRKSIVIQPMTSKDLAALYVFKLSLSMHRHERKHQLLQPPAPRQQAQAAKSTRAAAAADLSTKFKEKVSAPISDEDWIERIAGADCGMEYETVPGHAEQRGDTHVITNIQSPQMRVILHYSGIELLLALMRALSPGSRVSFSPEPISAVMPTYGAGDYDRSCIDPEPLSPRDIALLRMFRLSMPQQPTIRACCYSHALSTAWISEIAQTVRTMPSLGSGSLRGDLSGDEGESANYLDTYIWERVSKCCLLVSSV